MGRPILGVRMLRMELAGNGKQLGLWLRRESTWQWLK